MSPCVVSDPMAIEKSTQSRERPILFSAPMVRAILDGRKTQTRRVVKEPADSIEPHDGYPGEWSPWKDGERQASILCPYGVPGDRLWVRETWGTGTRPHPVHGWVEGIEYRADDFELDEYDLLPLHEVEPPEGVCLDDIKRGWRPSIHMFRWMSRITLELTDVRVQRLQDTTRLEIAAEGWPTNETQEGQVACVRDSIFDDDYIDDAAIEWYADLWEAINGKGSWDANPWVWALTFRRLDITKAD